MPIQMPSETAKALCNGFGEKAGLPLSRIFTVAILTGVYIGLDHMMTRAVQDPSSLLGTGFAQFLGGSVFTVGLVPAAPRFFGTLYRYVYLKAPPRREAEPAAAHAATQETAGRST